MGHAKSGAPLSPGVARLQLLGMTWPGGRHKQPSGSHRLYLGAEPNEDCTVLELQHAYAQEMLSVMEHAMPQAL